MAISWTASNMVSQELHGIDLVVMASQFHRAAQEAFSPELSQHLSDASTQLVEVGLSK